ncbi:MAG: tRNA(Ile)-lysidine synthetase, partial [Burkholderiaceae bacterium]|nr:tRNA(Ile)-lysidine synthetase [Burkholderiaceae bacterium]
MASSRARPKKPDRLEQQLLDTVRGAVARAALAPTAAAAGDGQALRHQSKTTRRTPNQTVALALSGGRDSMALLELLSRLAATRGTGIRRVIAIHIHHGLSRNADAWQAHCEAECERRGVPLAVRRVEVKRRGRGIEAAAR